MQKKYTEFHPGQIWYDTNGNRIQAHGGSVMYSGGKFYWYGENKEKTDGKSKIWTYGIRCYSSDDLYNWTDEGLICIPELDNPDSPLHPFQFADRPHIIFNEKNNLYVMWLKIMLDDSEHHQFMTILTCDKITGPFKILKRTYPLGMKSGDFDLYVDPDTKKAYIFFERVHQDMIVADLTDDYTDVSGEYSVHFPQPNPPFVREAPAFFVRDGKMYLFTSGTTAYFPNPSEVAVAEQIHGPWTVLGDPHVDDPGHDSYGTQISSVFRHPFKKDLYIALGDRWIPNLPEDRPDVCEAFDISYNPKRKGEIAPDLSGLFDGNTSLANYVWLPVSFENGMPVIHKTERWKTEDFD